MALTFLKGFQSPVEMGRHGVGFTLTPAFDPVRQAPSTDPVEIQRTTDSAGAPNVGAAVTIADKLFVPAAGLLYVDERSSTNDVWWYRYRHVSTGGVASNWSDWVPARSELIVPDLRTAGEGKMPLLSRGSLAPTSVKDLANGRYDLMLNGDFEDGFAYWTQIQGPAVTIETGADRYKGAGSLKLPVITSGTTPLVRLSDDSSGSPVGAFILLRVTPGETLNLRAAAKFSGAALGATGSVIVERFDDDGNANGSSSLSWTTETTFTEKEFEIVMSSIDYYISIQVNCGLGTSAGSFWVDEIHVFRVPRSAGFIDGRTDNITHSGNTTETALYQKVIPGGTFKIDARGIRVRGRAVIGPSSSGATEFKLKFGTIPLFVFASPDSSQREIHFDVTLLRTGLATAELSASEVRRFNAGVFETIIPVTGTPAPTWANANTLETTAQMGAAGSGVITMENWVVEYIG